MKSIKLFISIFALCCIALLCIMSCMQKKSYTINELGFWRGSKTYDLAKALHNENYIKAQALINQDSTIVNAPDLKFGSILLSWAIMTENKEAVEFLLRNGANPNHHDTKDGFSPMLEACYYSDADNSLDIIELLIKYGGDVNDICLPIDTIHYDYSIRSPLAALCARFNDKKSVDKVKYLIEKGAQIDLPYKPGYTPLCESVIHHNFRVSRYLIETCGADYRKAYVPQVDSPGDTVFLKSMVLKDYKNEPRFRKDKDFIWLYEYIKDK